MRICYKQPGGPPRRNETELANMRQQVETLHRGLEKGSQQKTGLQTEYEELQVTITRSQEMLTEELQQETS